jgi:hypothetical protein
VPSFIPVATAISSKIHVFHEAQQEDRALLFGKLGRGLQIAATRSFNSA